MEKPLSDCARKFALSLFIFSTAVFDTLAAVLISEIW